MNCLSFSRKLLLGKLEAKISKNHREESDFKFKTNKELKLSLGVVDKVSAQLTVALRR